MSQPVTAQQAAERARAYVTAAGAEETGALAAGYYLLFPGASSAGGGEAVSVKEGDTQVQFSEENAPPAMRRRLAEDLIDGARRDCTRWRRLIW